MPKATEEHRATQRQRILDAAITVIQRKGLASTTMGEIIKESGLSAGAIYGYYAGKDELIRDIQAKVKEQFDVDLEPEVHRVGEFL